MILYGCILLCSSPVFCFHLLMITSYSYTLSLYIYIYSFKIHFLFIYLLHIEYTYAKFIQICPFNILILMYTIKYDVNESYT